MPADEGALFRDSRIARLDPRVRLALALPVIICLAVLRSPAAAGLGLALACALLLLARPRLVPMARRLAVVNVFLFFLWCVTPLTMPGDAFWGIAAISREGVRLSLMVTLKANAITCIFLALVAGMDPSSVGYALTRLRCPQKLAFLFLFTGRYVPMLVKEWQNLVTTARLRAFEPRAHPHTYRTLASLLGLLLVRGYDRSVRVREAMLLRGFTGRFCSVTEFRVRPVDVFFACCVLAALAVVIAWEARGEHV
ncbi:MAG: Ni2+ ABC transporter permease NikQ [Candidatus Desulfovibrio kirbyi]|uniref:Ni2+ ABC transporter permease NikQ n=1 Tax=Candidatus Desulfovibrio kirbyi TaxID=2696086 RepID=A0A6L2R3U5_9BACT|nr:MAG: Ni2+ ABC transporter permease NikQ [Candidatus Desulfovibrio kirbyi]